MTRDATVGESEIHTVITLDICPKSAVLRILRPSI